MHTVKACGWAGEAEWGSSGCPAGFWPRGARSRAVAMTLATIVMMIAIGSVCGSEADGTNATTANAAAHAAEGRRRGR